MNAPNKVRSLESNAIFSTPPTYLDQEDEDEGKIYQRTLKNIFLDKFFQLLGNLESLIFNRGCWNGCLKS